MKGTKDYRFISTKVSVHISGSYVTLSAAPMMTSLPPLVCNMVSGTTTTFKAIPRRSSIALQLAPMLRRVVVLHHPSMMWGWSSRTSMHFSSSRLLLSLRVDAYVEPGSGTVPVTSIPKTEAFLIIRGPRMSVNLLTSRST